MAEELFRELMSQSNQAGKLLAAIVQNCEDAIIGKSVSGMITAWNPAAERIFGYREPEAVGQPISIIIPGELMGEEEEIRSRVRDGERICDFETLRRRKDGIILNVSLTISPVRDEDGQVLGASTIARDVSERKKFERDLRNREEDLRCIFDLSAQIPWTADPIGNILDFGKRLEEWTGYRREELIGTGWLAVIHPKDTKRILASWKRSLETGAPYDIEHRLRMDSCDVRWMRTRAFPRKNNDGRIVKWYGTTEDIHDRKLAQDATDRQSRLLDQAYEAILVRDAANRIVYWNKGAERLYGWSAHEALGRISHELFRTVFPQSLERIEQALQRDGHWEGELIHATRNDAQRTVRTHWVIEAGAGKPHIVETNFDVTELKSVIAREGQALSQVRAERRFRALLEAAPDGIFEVDEQGRIVLVNRVAEEMFGYHREELIGHSIDMLVPTEKRPLHGHERQRYNQNPTVRGMAIGLELQGQRKDGSRFPVEISLSPVHTEVGLHVAALVRDITARKEADRRLHALEVRYTADLTEKNRELEARNSELARASRAKSDFLASMSHELRTPLHTIIGFSELLAAKVPGEVNDQQLRFVNHVHRDAEHLLTLINDILDLSKIESGRLQIDLNRIDLGECIRESVEGLAPQAEAKSIRLENRANHSASLAADALRLKQILYNLLGNAIKFTPAHGSIWVETRLAGGFVEVLVGDTGIGIGLEEQKKIFDSFYQARSAIGGTGLGLAITKHLVELHGGRIWVESTPSEGSIFHFTLPVG